MPSAKKQEVTNNILAVVLNELNPSQSVADWLAHIEKTGHDPKIFFNGNGEGLEEYYAFTRTFDKDAHDRAMKSAQERKNRNKID